MSGQSQLSAAASERALQPHNYGPIQPCHGHAKITGSCGDAMEILFLGRIPMDPEIVRCADAGSCYVQRFAKNPAAEAFNEIVKHLHGCAAVKA